MPRISQREILSVVSSFYEAAQVATPASWRNAYLQMAKTFASGVGGFRVFDARKKTFVSIISTMSPELEADFLQSYQYISPIARAIAKLKPGGRYNRAEQLADDEFVNSEAYRRFYSPAGIFHFEYRAFVVGPDLLGGVAFSRPEGKPNFSKEELDKMSLVLPHLERAFQMYLSLADTVLENKFMSEAFDRISRSVLVIDRDLFVAFANNCAKEMLNEKDGLELTSDNRLKASIAIEDTALREMADSVFRGSGDDAGRVLLLARPSDLRPLELFFTQFSGDRYRAVDHQPLVPVFVSDPDRKGQRLDNLLGRIYGLTAAETRIAALIVEGQRISDICQTLDVTENTVRTHLKRIFSKTETNGQSELLKLILGGTASIHV